MEIYDGKDEARFDVLRGLFTHRNRTSACPACLACRSRSDKIKEHCERRAAKGDMDHTGFLFGSSTLETSYRQAIGFSPTAPLNFPTTWSACVDLDTIIWYKSSKDAVAPASKLDLLIQAAEQSAMSYICPLDLNTFDSMQRLRKHWTDESCNSNRTGLASEPTSTFIIAYQAAMGSTIPQEDLPLNLHGSEPGARSTHKCFEIGYVIKQMNVEKMVERYHAMKSASP